MSVSNCPPPEPVSSAEVFRSDGPSLEELALKSDLADAEWERKEAEARAAELGAELTLAREENRDLRAKNAELRRTIKELTRAAERERALERRA